MVKINTVINEVDQVPILKSVNDGAAVLLVAADPRRIKLRVTLPLNTDTMSLVIASTQADANALKGECIGQAFPSNASIFMRDILFDTDSAAQSAKWGKVDSSLQQAATSFNVFVNEYKAN